MTNPTSDTRIPLLGDHDVDALRAQMHGAPGFPHFCIDGFLEEAFAEDVLGAFPTYRQAKSLGHSFEAVNEKHKVQITDSTRFGAPIRRLHELLSSDAFVARMAYVSGIPNLVADAGLAGGGIHETDHGGRLDVHVDFNFNEQLGLYRRLNLLVYFNKNWEPRYGGYLDLWDKDVRNCLGQFAPSFNRAAAFATSDISWHGVTPVDCPPGQARKSFAIYYYSKEPPPGWDGVKRSTVFRPRPDEYLRGAIAMPAESALRSGRETARAVKQGIRKIFTR